MNVGIRPAKKDELESLHSLITSNDEWMKFNGPYFPYSHPSLEQFKHSSFQRLLAGSDLQLITVNDIPVGTVSCYWECEDTRWQLFTMHSIGGEELLRLLYLYGFRTYSTLKTLSFQQEVRLRKVRYYNGEYYDSIKYGVLRSEWAERT